MHPGSVEKHRGEDVGNLTARMCEAIEAALHLERSAGPQGFGQLAWNKAEITNRARQTRGHTRSLDEDPHEDIDRDNGDSDVRRPLSFVFVTIREHGS